MKFKSREPGIITAQRNYDKWWLGKCCKVALQPQNEYKLVKEVKLFGSASFINGSVILVYDDGTDELLLTTAWKPRKRDVLVRDESK